MDVSIIVPNYNGSDFIQDCLISLLNQSDKVEYEIIVIDDNSNDNSLELIRLYIKKSSKISLLVNDVNKGQAYTRNRGLDIAQGDYICFVDSDDFVSNNFIEKMFNAISINKVDIAISNFKAVDDKGILISKEKNIILENSNLICQLLDASCSAVVWDKIYKRDIINEYQVRFNTGLVNEDILFNFNYMTKVKKHIYINEYIINYRQHGNSVTKRYDIKTILDMNTIFHEIIKSSDFYSDEYIRKAIVDFYIYYVVTIGLKRAFRIKQYNKLIFAIFKILKTTPNFISISSVLRSKNSKFRIFCSVLILSLAKVIK